MLEAFTLSKCFLVEAIGAVNIGLVSERLSGRG